MKRVILNITLTAILVTVIPLSGCARLGLGSTVTEGKDFADFTRVEVDGTFEVRIVQSESYSTIVSADESFFEYVDVSTEGETLKIRLHPRHAFTDFTLQARTLKAEITMPALYVLCLSGASKGTVTGFKSLRDLNLDVSGASSLEMKKIEVGDVEMEISGASRVSGDMNADDVALEVSGASKIELRGSANSTILKASGASRADLADFPLVNANVELSGASEATVHAKGRLDCVLSAASRLYFMGNPTMGNVAVSGASTIKHK